MLVTLLLQVTVDDVKDVVPEEYLTKHITFIMRTRVFAKVIGTRRIIFMVLAKVDRNFTPRDLLKLKDRLKNVVTDAIKDKMISPDGVYHQLMDVAYEKQISGMRKCNTEQFTVSSDNNFSL